MGKDQPYRFDPVNHEFMHVRGRLSPGARLQAMLAVREWVVSAMRSRLRLRYPDLSPEEINLRVLKELEHTCAARMCRCPPAQEQN